MGFVVGGLDDRFDNCIEGGVNVAVSETQYSISVRIQDSVPGPVRGRFGLEAMLPAINFDDKPRTAALEIDDVAVERRLASKVKAE